MSDDVKVAIADALIDDALFEQRRMHEDQACACGEFDDPELPDHGCVLADGLDEARAEIERLRDELSRCTCQGCRCFGDHEPANDDCPLNARAALDGDDR